MSAEERSLAIRRILVALDASPHSLAALQVAAELAERLDAELLGIYVEDITLLRLAEFPLAREVSIYTMQPRAISRKEVESQLRIQARQARRALENIAARSRLRWSFRVAQGLIHDELLAAAEETDLILIGKSGWSRRRRLGSTARVIVTQAPTRIMVLQHGVHLGLPVGTVYDGSELARSALQTVVSVLEEREGYMVVMILAETLEQARELQNEVVGQVRDKDLHIHYRWLIHPTLTHLRQVVEAERCGMLVIPGDGKLIQREQLADLLDQVDCPVLLIR